MGTKFGNSRSHRNNDLLPVSQKMVKVIYFFKNWRPITLLNVAFKIGSGCIAQRIRNMLDIIISPDQYHEDILVKILD